MIIPLGRFHMNLKNNWYHMKFYSAITINNIDKHKVIGKPIYQIEDDTVWHAGRNRVSGPSRF
tara:strand:+ start:447 stop:635 length:189 start_codon:yes stop_codon:yes gene_type:complete